MVEKKLENVGVDGADILRVGIIVLTRDYSEKELLSLGSSLSCKDFWDDDDYTGSEMLSQAIRSQRH